MKLIIRAQRKRTDGHLEKGRERKEREGRFSDVMPRLSRGHTHTQFSLKLQDSEVWWEFQKVKMTSCNLFFNQILIYYTTSG